MTSFKIECAGLIIEICGAGEHTMKKCEKYLADSAVSDVVVVPKKRHIDAAKKFSQNAQSAEFDSVLCALHEKLLEHGRCVLHSAVVSVDGIGYAFAAPSGGGKTTQTVLWKKHFKERCTVVNGDKPIIAFKGNTAYACGSPWCGKEGRSENISVPLRGICFVEKADSTSIRRLDSDEIIDRLFYQLSVPPHDSVLAAKCLQIADRLVEHTPFYLLCCNVSDEAVIKAYEEMSK